MCIRDSENSVQVQEKIFLITSGMIAAAILISVLIAWGISREPVSYTHLDVYKRQF